MVVVGNTSSIYAANIRGDECRAKNMFLCLLRFIFWDQKVPQQRVRTGFILMLHLCVCSLFSLFSQNKKEDQSTHRPVGRTGLVRESRLVAVPTAETLRSRAWRQAPQRPGTARETWPTAGSPGWAWSESTCTGTSHRLEEGEEQQLP